MVPAAGRGTRFGGEIPKQYLEVAGRPLIAYTLDVLLSHPTVSGVMVVLAENDRHWRSWAARGWEARGCEARGGKPVMTCAGGVERADSVLAGLNALPDTVRADAFVLVHDAARPNLSHADLDRLLDLGMGDPVGAILAAPVRDTLKFAGDDGGIDRTEPRERLWRAFTPQMFRRMQLSRALAAAHASGMAITDESMAMERQGLRPLLVEGSEDNFKVTTPADLARFEYALSQRHR